ncbi:MAG: DNA primase [Lachnospiraceae bacterium]|nr:DNA primase [Lachnospiraceae bacterium]
MKLYLSDTEIKNRIKALNPQNNPIYNNMDDASDGRLFADIFKDIARYNVTAKCWYVYNGIVWEEDIGGTIVSLYAERLYTYLFFYSVDKGTDYKKHVSKLGSLSNRKRMLEDASKHYAVKQTDFDANPSLLNMKNGILNLDTMELLPHMGDHLLTKCCNCSYNPDIVSEDFLKFLDEVMCSNKEKSRYLQKVSGLGLTCNTNEEECYILYGQSTRNGKSTLLETIGYLLGDYGMNVAPETLAQKKKDGRTASGDLARLNQCRFLRMSEPPKRMIFDIALLKTLLGRDTITARHLFEREFEFIPVFTLYINTNYLPTVNDDTVFSSGRIKVITFDRHFEESEQDKGLKQRLRTEDNLSGILNWLLQGLELYRSEGLEPPLCVVNATNQYRENSDKLSLFVDDTLIEDNDSIISANELYKNYAQWCRENNYGEESKRTFLDELRAHNMLCSTGTIKGKTVRNVVKGFKIDTDFVNVNPHDTPFEY